jgi:shikimate kinase
MTLFLNDSGIRSLAELISKPDPEFELDYPTVEKKYVYYVIGSVGAGKTTTTNNFRNLVTYDEWVDERRPELSRPESELSPAEIQEVDEWIADQFRMKNFAVAGAKEGIHLIDRCPLDPLTFGESSGRKRKAKRLLDRITDKGTRGIEKGHVIFLDGPVEELKRRISFKHRYWTSKQISDLVDEIRHVYGSIDRSVIKTEGRDIQDVIREVSQIIFREKYTSVDIEGALRAFT